MRTTRNHFTLTHIRGMRAGEFFYSPMPAVRFTYVTRYNIKVKTEVFIAVNAATLKAERITKVTIIENPHAN